MRNSDPRLWMWSEALAMVSRAERLRGQMFQPAPAPQRGRAVHWEPPVDLIETEHELLVFAALPGVDPDRIQVTITAGSLVLSGDRVLPPELRTATIHRLELPQGRFERQISLPPGRYEVARPRMVNGCLVVALRKLA